MKTKTIITALLLTVCTSTSSADSKQQPAAFNQDAVFENQATLLMAANSNQEASYNPCLTWPICKD